MSIKLVKDKTFEYLYIKDAIVYFASVQEPKKKYAQPVEGTGNQSTREYAATVFVTDEDREVLEDEVMINKQLFKVGKDKNKKRKVKYPTSDQVDEDGHHYDDVKGLNGLQLTLNEFTSKGKPANMLVVDSKGQPFDELVGNGSKVNIKCFGYRNQDDQLVVSLNIMQVLEHVPYESTNDGKIHDDELGIDIQLPKSEGEKVAEEFATEEEDAPADADKY